MDDQISAEATGAGSFSGFDTRLLQHMATSIQTAHDANPRCWALSRTTTGSIPLHIHATVVLTIRQVGGDFYGSGDPESVQAEEFRVLARRGGDDRFVLASLNHDQFDTAYGLFLHEHNALIADRAPVVKTRPMRADGHSQALVGELSHILGINLPTPLYLSDDPVQGSEALEVVRQPSRLPSNYENLSGDVKAIYDGLSEEGKTAVNALPDDLFTDAEGDDCSGIFLDSILRAHERAPESWSLVSFGKNFSGFIALNIQNKNIATIWRDALTVEGQRESIVAWPEEKDLLDEIASDNSNSESPTVRVPIRSSVPSSTREQFIDAHHVLIDRLARGRSGIQAKNHRDDLRVKLALVTGVPVPAPGYVPTDTYGLPFGLRIVERESKIEQAVVAVNTQPTTSSQAIYDELSEEGKAAVDALPDDLFTDPEGIDRSQWILKSLRLAHAGSPVCWAFMGGAGAVLLTVGVKNMISMRDKMRFVVLRGLVREDVLQGGLQAYISYDRYGLREDIVQVQVDIKTPREAQMELERAHYETVSRLAKGKIGSQGRNHKDSMRVKLALVTGEYVPAPEYIPESTYGIPNGLRIADGGGEAVGDQEPSIEAAGKATVLIHVPSLLSEAFGTAGLKYTDSQIASFYTALQTKGFVILSGISGTGKSKIAQRFAGMLPLAGVRSHDQVASTFVHFSPYMKTSGRFYVPKKLADLLPPMRKGEDVFPKIGINDFIGTCRLNLTTHDKPDTYVYLKDDAAIAFADLQDDGFYLTFQLNALRNSVESVVIRSKPVKLEEPGVFLRTYATPNGPGYLFLPVRPDWRDGKALIGYHNPLTGEYVRTDFLDFVIAAGDDYRAGNHNAFFVILDEMNLAHVEYYFADVLSVIESGRDEDGWTVEGIPLAVGEEDADLPEVLKLPPNLYIVGTVNMDETTHPFSPKVLDRAFTIELTDVDFRDYPPEPMEGGVEPSDDERQALLETFTGGGQRYPRIDKDEIRETVAKHDQFRAHLDTLNRGLQRYRMHFGYRVFDEIMQFVHNAERNSLFASAEDAFDHAVLMKVLPKFNGSRAKLEPALLELIHWCRSSSTFSNDVRQTLEAQIGALSAEQKRLDTIVVDSDVAEDRWRYPTTGRRAALMMQDLYTDGFASFG